MSVRTLTSGWVIVKEIPVSSTRSRVFGALTKPSHLNKWFTHGARVNLRVGGSYANKDEDKGKFLEIVANERLRFTWDNPYIARGTIVEILLKRIEGRTVVTLIHSGFKHRKDFEHYVSKESGWNWALENLKAHLEHRRIIGYEEWLRKTKS